MNLDYNKISLNIKSLRVKHNHNQSHLADTLSMSNRSYRDYENKPSRFTLTHLSKITELFDITILELLCIEIRQIVNGQSIGSVNGQDTSYVNDLAIVRDIYEKQIEHLKQELARIQDK